MVFRQGLHQQPRELEIEKEGRRVGVVHLKRAQGLLRELIDVLDQGNISIAGVYRLQANVILPENLPDCGRVP